MRKSKEEGHDEIYERQIAQSEKSPNEQKRKVVALDGSDGNPKRSKLNTINLESADASGNAPLLLGAIVSQQQAVKIETLKNTNKLLADELEDQQDNNKDLALFIDKGQSKMDALKKRVDDLQSGNEGGMTQL